MPYLILFDIDGTLQNFKSGLAYELFSEILEVVFNRNVPIDAFPNFSGMTDLQILYDIANAVEYPIEDLNSKLPQIWELIFNQFEKVSNSENITLLPGINELINELVLDSTIKLALITGNFKGNAYLKLKAHNLEHFFPCGAFGDDHHNRNELPHIAIERAKQYYKTDVFNNLNTIIIGDTDKDIKCAKINNIPVLSVATGSNTIEELMLHQPDALLSDLSDTSNVISIINKLLNRNK